MRNSWGGLRKGWWMMCAAMLGCGICFGAEPGGAEVWLTLQNPSGLRHSSWPVTTGVPFPDGALKRAEDTALFDEAGRAVPLQTRITSTWAPQGSARWLLLDFQTPLDGSEKARYRLRFGPNVKSAKPSRAIAIRDLDGKSWEVATGPLTFVIRRDRFDGVHQATLHLEGKDFPVIRPGSHSGPYLLNGEGRIFRAAFGPADEVRIEEQGPLRCVFGAEGWYYSEAGEKFCRYTVRIHAYAGQPFLKLLYTFLVTETRDKARFRDIGFSLSAPAMNRCAFGGDNPTGHAVEEGRSVYLLQYDCDKFVVRRGDEPRRWEETPPGKQSPGWVQGNLGGAPLGITLACKEFWQQFPKEWEVIGGKGITFHVWPAHGVAKPNREVNDAMLQYLWFAHEGEVLDFTVPESYHTHKEGYSEYEYRYLRSSKDDDPIGLAKTHELLIWFHPAAENATIQRSVEAWQEDPVVMADPKWMCASGVFGRLHPYDPQRFPKVERALSKGWDCERRLEAHTKDYGMWNWGDGHTVWNTKHQRWHDVYRCWRAFHHGAPRTSWVLYFRSGDPKYWRHAIRNARHCMDIDMCHWSKPELENLEWPLGKIKGALHDYKGITHWHAGGRLFDYNCLADFMLWYYYMTGDHRGWDVANEWAESVKKHFTAPHGSRSGAGVVSSLIEVYKATWNPEYKHIIDQYIDHLFDKVQNMKGTTQPAPDVVAAVPSLAGKPLPIGAFPEWENYAPWIENYYELTRDTRTAERIVAWANAYLEGWGDSWSGSNVGAYVNVLAYAYFVSKDPKYLARGLWAVEKYVNSVEEAPGQLHDGFPHEGQMSLGPGYMSQRIPYFLAALAEHGKPVEPEGPPPGPFNLLFTRQWPDGKKTEYVDALIREEKDGLLRILAQGQTTYTDKPIRALVISPSGKEVLRKEFLFQKGAFEMTLEVPPDKETGIYKLQIWGEGSFWGIRSTLRAEPGKVIYPLSGRIVRLDKCRYYFFVPKGTKAFTVSLNPIGTGASFAIRDPEGKIIARASVPVGEEAAKHAVRVDVSPAHQGKAWAFDGHASHATVEIKGEGAEIPPYFATAPEELFAP